MADVQTSDALNEDPLLGFFFQLDLNNIEGAGFFTTVSGLGSETEVVEAQFGDRDGNIVDSKTPGKLTWKPIELTRGITRNMELCDWRELVIEGRVDSARSNGSIAMLDSSGSRVAEWNFFNAWPSDITGPDLDVDSNDVGVEKITIVHEGIKRIS